MGDFYLKTFVMVTISVVLLTKEAYSQFFCPPGKIRHPITQLCVSLLKGGPGGRWKSGGFGDITYPLPIPKLCLPGEVWVNEECVPILKGPGGRWKSGGFGGATYPLPITGICPPGEYWVASWGKCIPYVRGPGGRWKGGWSIGNLLPVPQPFAFALGPVCPPGEVWHELFQDCVPWLKGPGGRWKSGPGGRWRSGPGGRWRSGPGGRWRSRQCPPGMIWAPGFTHCIPRPRPPVAVLDDDFDSSDTTCFRCWG